MVGVRHAERAESEIARALAEMAELGEVVLRSYAVQDPRLAFDHLDFVAPVAAYRTERAVRDAELAAERAYNEWLADWLGSHRCT